MTNKEKALAVYNTMYKSDYCSQWMGIDLVDIDEGYCKIMLTVKREMLNGFGILHGGIAYAFADSAFAFASNSYGRMAVSINGMMSYASSAREGEKLIAVARSLHVTYRTADFDVNIYDSKEENVLYYFRGTVYRKTQNILSDK